MSKLTKGERRKLYCSGCEDDFYNRDNHSHTGECWGLKDAKIVKKVFVHVDHVPPWDIEPVKTHSCHKRRRYVAMNPKYVKENNARVIASQKKAASMNKETEQDRYIEIGGYEVYCLCKFHEGYLYSVVPYSVQSKDWIIKKIGNLLPFLNPKLKEEIETDHADALKL